MSQQDSTQAKFRKASKKDSEQPQIEENEVRIKGNMGNVKRYVDYACGLLIQKDEPKKEKEDTPKQEDENDNKDDEKNDDKEKEQKKKQFKTIVLKATGRAINKAVTTAEVVKRRVAGLHQDTKLETLEIVDVWEPTEEGLKQVETTRRVASITITLSLDEKKIEEMKKSTGYQPPIAPEAVKSTPDFPSRRAYRGGKNQRYGRRNYGSNRGRNYNRYGGQYGYGGNRYRGGFSRRGGGSYRGGNRYYGGGYSYGGSRGGGQGGYNRGGNRSYQYNN